MEMCWTVFLQLLGKSKILFKLESFILKSSHLAITWMGVSSTTTVDNRHI